MNPKRKTIGVRVPDNHIVHSLLEALGQPIMSCTLLPAVGQEAIDDVEALRRLYEHEVELVIDGGFCGLEPSTVISLIDSIPEVIRYGKGPVEFLEA